MPIKNKWQQIKTEKGRAGREEGGEEEAEETYIREFSYLQNFSHL